MIERRSPDRTFRLGFELLCWEGAFATAYDALTSAGYITGLAGEVKLSLPLLALLTTLPSIGALGPLLGLALAPRMGSVKRLTLVMATVARAIWLIPLVLGAAWGARTALGKGAFPTGPWFALLALCMGLSQLFATAGGVGWNSWMSILIPPGVRGRFFGCKQHYGMIALILANGLAALLVGWRPRELYLGYGLMGLAGVVMAALSTRFLSRVPEAVNPRQERLSERACSLPGLRASLAGAARDRAFLPILLFGTVFNGAMQIASPYFSYYFARDLHVPLSSIAVWTLLGNLGSFAAARAWGKRLDRLGDPRRILLWTGCAVALSPLFYVFLDASSVRWVAPIDYLTNGMVSSGFALATSAMLFARTPSGSGAAYFALYAALNGIAGAMGSSIGARLIEWLAPLGGFRALWLIGSAARFAVLGWAALAFTRSARESVETESAA